MSQPAPPDIIRRSALFDALEMDVVDDILSRATRRDLDRHQVVARQGDAADVMSLVESGYLKLVQLTPSGQEVIVRFVGPGEPFGGVAALDPAVYPVTARAMEPTRLWQWSRSAIRPLLETYPRLKTNLLATLAAHMDDALTRVRELVGLRVPQRLAHALLRLVTQTGRRLEPGVALDLPLTREELAEMTGTTLYSVSRILSGWQAEGIVSLERRRILITSPERLRRLADAG